MTAGDSWWWRKLMRATPHPMSPFAEWKESQAREGFSGHHMQAHSFISKATSENGCRLLPHRGFSTVKQDQ